MAPIFHRFLMDLGAEMEEKSIQKRDVKGNTENYENCILASTRIKFLSPQSIKKLQKIKPKSKQFPDRVFGSILNGFWKDFGPILGAKMKPKSIQKRVRRFLKKR